MRAKPAWDISQRQWSEDQVPLLPLPGPTDDIAVSKVGYINANKKKNYKGMYCNAVLLRSTRATRSGNDLLTVTAVLVAFNSEEYAPAPLASFGTHMAEELADLHHLKKL